MNRNTRTLLVVGVAVVTATLASVGVYRAIRRIPVREIEGGNMRMVVASRELPMGTRITKDDLKVVAWPSSTKIAGSFASIDQVVDRGLVASVVDNEPITESKLAPIEAGSGLPPAIPPGMRAISVKVNEVIGVAGFVVPGTRVDVLVTVKQEQHDSMSRVVVGNAQVLTAGTRFDQDKARRDGKPIPTTVVTLMVTPEDSERIALAETEGKLMLSLRNPLDQQPTATSGIRMASLMGSPAAQEVVKTHAPAPRKQPPAAAPEPPPAPKLYTVETIRAAKRSEEVVK